MPRPSSRELVLDAYEEQLRATGPAAVTLEAVARQAGVSKGGLLYHFPSKDALRDALLHRLEERNAEDIRRARSCEPDAVTYYLRTSFTDVTEEDPPHRTLMAVIQLAVHEPSARATLARTTQAWRTLLAEETGDESTARLLTVLGDGLYLHAVLDVDESPLLGALPELLNRLRPSAG
ncbi:TetR/AcrR family transcriptional regulator [Streptomyces sp. XM4193]|uniref:TetR/AcrR family transcriptional regulator n=1 Tax=Streptomyces sp. XM4193 TaxID=2929782 RepID=UPI0024A63318|nr:TetR/AcrR family transcriptional regulator [Streptomyces sp. XM4193]